MGILSRKMALTGPDQAAVSLQPIPGAEPLSPQMSKIISEDNFTDVRVTSNPTIPTDGVKPNAPPPMAPVLGKKNYTQTIGRNRRAKAIEQAATVV